MTQRPVFLDLFKMRFPITAIISICHRISGVLLFLFLPLLIYLLGASIASEASFLHLKVWIHQPGIAFLIWLMLSASTFHFFAGIRHIIMDFGFFEHLNQARQTAYAVIGLTGACVVLIGVWLW